MERGADQPGQREQRPIRCHVHDLHLSELCALRCRPGRHGRRLRRRYRRQPGPADLPRRRQPHAHRRCPDRLSRPRPHRRNHRPQPRRRAGRPIPAGISGKCLDDYDDATDAGAKADLYSCNGSTAQWWSWNRENGTITVNGMCLDVAGQNTANGTAVDVWTCNNDPNQRWSQAANGALVSTQSGKCLDDPGFADTDGTPLDIWTCDGGANQQWTLP
ncbi:MAG TPA: ricin-type beta-trefoil lectin domain protein [Pseudonocardiaceae bacterium]